ncbi:MAG: sensor histidine kinase [Sulfurimonas sp.]
MFKYIFFTLLLLLSSLSAMPTVQITSDETKLENFELQYYVDKKASLKLSDVITKDFTDARSTLSLGAFKKDTWFRFKIHNETAKEQKIFIHNEHGYLAHAIDFYELKNSQILNTESIVLSEKKSFFKNMYGSDAIFSTILKSNETKTIYIKNNMKVMQFPRFALYDKVNSKIRVSKNNSMLFIILGMLMALALYHAILYLSTRQKEYLYYALYLSSAIIWEALLSGLLANNFSIYFNSITEYLLLSLFFIPVFLTFFAKSIFNTESDYKYYDKYLNSILLIFFLSLIISIFDLYLAVIMSTILYIYMFITLFITSYFIMKQGNQVAFIFLLSNTVFSLFMLPTYLYYIGLIDYTPLIFNAASLGMVIESLMLAFLLSYKIKLLQKSEIKKTEKLLEEVRKSRKKDEIFFQQNKMNSMGEMIENIAHQWRQPLSQINSSVLLIDEVLYQKEIRDTEIEKELKDIENLTSYMSKTIDSFRGFFDRSKKQTDFSFQEIIESSLIIIKNSVKLNNIDIKISIEDTNYYGLKEELQQVIIILLNNAKDVLIERQTNNAEIMISGRKSKNTYTIAITDNAGGIMQQQTDKIFEPYFTTKHQTQGTGLGLYISKIIIEENMLGRLSAKNIIGGASFSIELPIG